MFESSVLFFWDNFFDYDNHFTLFSPRITASATTGPARLPLPTSSTPAKNLFNFFLLSGLLRKILFFLNLLKNYEFSYNH